MLLMLKRAIGEWIMVGDHLLVGVTGIHGSLVGVAIKGQIVGGAHDGAQIDRTEQLTFEATCPIIDGVTLISFGVHGGQARLGINRTIPIIIHRKEVYDAFKREAKRRGHGDAS